MYQTNGLMHFPLCEGSGDPEIRKIKISETANKKERYVCRPEF